MNNNENTGREETNDNNTLNQGASSENINVEKRMCLIRAVCENGVSVKMQP